MVERTMTSALRILMVAAENDGLPGAKVGGIGDVVRDVPPALAALPSPTCHVSVVVPSYGCLHKNAGSKLLDDYAFPFAGSWTRAELYQVPGRKLVTGVTHFVLHHSSFEYLDPITRKPRIYCDDPPEAPFATDATKFACFCAAVAQGILVKSFGNVNRLHLHDWHAAFLLILRSFDKMFDRLNTLRTVYTIHNLALQGIRPLRGHPSSLQEWYPQLKLQPNEEAQVTDPEYANCVNPMAVGIRLSDAVHVVSPGYKEEILYPSVPKRGDTECVLYGGEGLECDLQKSQSENRLFGILNGCDYDDRKMPPRDLSAYQELLSLLYRTVSNWATEAPIPAHDLALKRIRDLQRAANRRPDALVTCVTRVVSQKVRLMQIPIGEPALGKILQGLGESAVILLLGTGDKNLEQFMLELSSEFPHFLFLNGFDNACAGALYANGDLFLMPSSFEPCGISQMLAMRDGQPCIVHHVGGLKNTVADGKTGFSFSGADPNSQAANFIEKVSSALGLLRGNSVHYRAIRDAAFQERFLWSDSVQQYVEQLYR
jgi:starch synthase